MSLKVGMDFLPMQDNSEFQITLKGPVGINLETMKQKVIPIDAMLKGDPSIAYSIISVGYDSAKSLHKARIYVKLKPVKDRTISQLTLIEQYRAKMKDIHDLTISVEKVDDFDTGDATAPLQVVITGDKFDTLDETSTKLMEFLKSVQGVVDIDRDYESGKPEMKLSILRENAQRVG